MSKFLAKGTKKVKTEQFTAEVAATMRAEKAKLKEKEDQEEADQIAQREKRNKEMAEK